MKEQIIDLSKLVISYIEQILSSEEVVNGNMDFGSHNIDNKDMCTLDIYVPQKKYERHINTGITKDKETALYGQLFEDLLDTFIEHETMGISKSYTIRSNKGDVFNSVRAISSNGSEIGLNFIHNSLDFDDIVANYNNKINDYVNGGIVR